MKSDVPIVHKMQINHKHTRFPKWKFPMLPLLFILPAVLLTVVFFIIPLIQSFLMSFYNWPLLGSKKFIGLANYKHLFVDQQFWNSLIFTGKYTIVVTLAIFFLAFGLALLVKERLPGINLFRAIYFLPVVISMVSSSLLWLWIYNDSFGILNYYLLHFKIIDSPIVWMGDSKTSLPAIMMMIVWKTTGFTMIIILAGLQSISEEVYEAATIDGANRWSKFWYITLPMLKPTMALAMILSVTGSVLAFEQFLIMTSGGPSNSTMTIVHYIYNTSFKYFHLGYGSAMTFILLLVLMGLSLVQMRVLRNPTE